MTTPRKRAREEDDEDEDKSPSFLARITELFSTAKKEPKRKKRSVESSTQPTQMPRLNLSSPHAHVSPRAEADVARAPPVPTEAATNGAATPVPVPASRPPAPSPWQAAPIRFSPGFSAPLASNRLRPYRPMSRTLVVAARRRHRPRNTEYNAELVARILAQSEGLFQPQDSGYRATTTVRGRRLMGTNQCGSRLAAAPPSAASRQVRFKESPAHVQEPSQGMVATPRLPAQKRVATPYAAHPAQPEVSPAGTSASINREYPLPLDYMDMDRPAASSDAKFRFDVAEDEPGDAPQTALVTSTRSITTFSATSAPLPSRDPRHIFHLGQQVSEADEPVEESPTEEQERTPQEEPTPKKLKPEGWGDLFATVPKGWKCDSCGISNNSFSADKCPACETKRPEDVATGGEAGGGAAAGGGSNGELASGASVPFVFGANGNGANGIAPLFAFGDTIGSGGFKFGGAETKNEDKGVFEFGTTATSTGGFSFGISEKSSQAEAPKLTGFSFGNPNESKEDAPKKEESEKKEETETPETSVLNSNVPFSFGTFAPSASANFSFSIGGMTAAPSAPLVTTAMPTTFRPAPALGSSAPAPTHDDNRKKKRRSTDDDKEEEWESTASAASTRAPPLFGSNAPTVVQPFVFVAPATPARTAADTVSFGAPTAVHDSQGGAAVSCPAPAPSGNAPTFGAMPAPATPAQSFTFGSTPVASSIRAPASEAPTPSTDGFGQSGSNPFGTSAASFKFGVTSTASAMTPALAAPAYNFGGTSTASVMTPVPAVPALIFGGVSTAAPAAPTAFGTTAPPPPSQGFSFGSTPVPAYVATFGAPVAVAPAPSPAGPYGATAAAAAATGGLSLSGFGGPTTTPAPTPGFGGFGVTPSTTPAAPGDFGATPSLPPFTLAGAGGFSIGSGGGGGRSAASTGRRRIVRAKRPPGSSGR